MMKLKRTKKKRDLQLVAQRLNSNLPQSEKWFQDFWKKSGLEHERGEYNKPWMHYIPDVINHKFKYVIEIDGSIHEKRSQKKRDLRKDKVYEINHYTVFRVEAFNDEMLLAIAECIERIRG